MCDKFIIENCAILAFIPDCYKCQKMCEQAVDNYYHALRFGPSCYKTKKKKLLVLILLQYSFFLNVIRLTKCVIKLLIFILLYLILFLIDICLSKCVIKLFPKNLLS